MKKKIIAGITWSSDYGDTPNRAELIFTEKDIEKIKLCKKLIKENDLFGISIGVNRDRYFDEGEGESLSDWRTDTEMLKVTAYGTYYYAQGKWDASDQIESEDIERLIFKEEKEAKNEK